MMSLVILISGLMVVGNLSLTLMLRLLGLVPLFIHQLFLLCRPFLVFILVLTHHTHTTHTPHTHTTHTPHTPHTQHNTHHTHTTHTTHTTLRDAEAYSHGPDCYLDHRVSPVACDQGVLSLSCRSCRFHRSHQQFLDKLSCSFGVSTGAVLGQGYAYTCCGPDSAYRLKVRSYSSLWSSSSCHYAEADSHGPCDQEIPLSLDIVIDFPVVQVVQFPGYSPDVQKTGFLISSSTCPLLCMIIWRLFEGRVHRHTAMVDPRHQGGEGVAGTPGACSQVFCHPISCT